MIDDAEPPVDRALLAGFSFRCRPGCGLCCYATPAVTPSEQARLVQLEPAAPFFEEGTGFARIASRPNGGACYFLSDNLCRCHPIRPFPCAEYPLGLHVGERSQLTVQLACPGVDLAPLLGWGEGAPSRTEPAGVDAELDAIAREYREQPVREWIEAARRELRQLSRRLGRNGIDWDLAEARRGLERSPPLPAPSDYPAEAPPEEEAPLESLPIFFDPDFGRVVLRDTAAGWELLAVAEAGDAVRSLGRFEPPARPPGLAPDAERLLRGYLRYAVGRDHVVYSVLEELAREPSVSPGAALETRLRWLGATVLSRGSILARARDGERSRLRREEVEAGIRATDAELMDRPTLGRVL